MLLKDNIFSIIFSQNFRELINDWYLLSDETKDLGTPDNKYSLYIIYGWYSWICVSIKKFKRFGHFLKNVWTEKKYFLSLIGTIGKYWRLRVFPVEHEHRGFACAYHSTRFNSKTTQKHYQLNMHGDRRASVEQFPSPLRQSSLMYEHDTCEHI